MATVVRISNLIFFLGEYPGTKFSYFLEAHGAVKAIVHDNPLHFIARPRPFLELCHRR
jgi:hypothetical protein